MKDFQLIELHTSIRERKLEQSLKLVEDFAARFEISRVTCTTYLDSIGIPVYTGVRPNAMDGSLCVSAGKGLTFEEAKIGAYMEAIEFALSEPRYSSCEILTCKYSEILNTASRSQDLLDLCPIIGKQIDLNSSVPCVAAKDILNDKEYLVPAELAFIPFQAQPTIFGNHSNGLASGNSFEEACIHGIFEVIERDILSFEMIKDTSNPVEINSLKWFSDIMETIAQADCNLVLRNVDNIYSLPFFAATLIDTNDPDPRYLSSGYGTHSNPKIAVIRAITEAAQSRLTYIHGARDDLLQKDMIYDSMAGDQLRSFHLKKMQQLTNNDNSIDLSQLEFNSIQATGISDFLNKLKELLRKLGIKNILAIRHSQPQDPFQVIKIVIPKMEFYNSESRRIGPRLRNYAEYITSDTLRRSKPESAFKVFD